MDNLTSTPPESPAIFWGSFTLCFVTVILGSIGNLMFFIVLEKYKPVKIKDNAFHVFIAIIDTISSIIVRPLYLFNMFFKEPSIQYIICSSVLVVFWVYILCLSCIATMRMKKILNPVTDFSTGYIAKRIVSVLSVVLFLTVLLLLSNITPLCIRSHDLTLPGYDTKHVALPIGLIVLAACTGNIVYRYTKVFQKLRRNLAEIERRYHMQGGQIHQQDSATVQQSELMRRQVGICRRHLICTG